MDPSLIGDSERFDMYITADTPLRVTVRIWGVYITCAFID